MKIRNKNTGAEYSSEDLAKEGSHYLDRSVMMDNGDGKPIAFMTLEDGWEEIEGNSADIDDNIIESFKLSVGSYVCETVAELMLEKFKTLLKED